MELPLAEQVLPKLILCREKFGPAQLFKGLNKPDCRAL